MVWNSMDMILLRFENILNWYILINEKCLFKIPVVWWVPGSCEYIKENEESVPRSLVAPQWHLRKKWKMKNVVDHGNWCYVVFLKESEMNKMLTNSSKNIDSSYCRSVLMCNSFACVNHDILKMTIFPTSKSIRIKTKFHYNHLLHFFSRIVLKLTGTS